MPISRTHQINTSLATRMTHRGLCRIKRQYYLSHVVNIFRHYKSLPFHTVVRISLISLLFHIFVFFAISFYFHGQMLVLMLNYLLTFRSNSLFCSMYAAVSSSIKLTCIAH